MPSIGDVRSASVNAELAKELAGLVLAVMSDYEEILDLHEVDYDDVHFEFPEWYLKMEAAALDIQGYNLHDREEHMKYLISHERDVRVGLPHWWHSSGKDGAGARSIFERRATASALRAQQRQMKGRK